MRPRVAAALLLDGELAPLIELGPVPIERGGDAGGVAEGYWAPAWFAGVLDSDTEPETFGAFEIPDFGGKSRKASQPAKPRGFTRTAVQPGDAVAFVLRAMAREDDDGREAFEGALRLGGLRAALALLDDPGEAPSAAASAALAAAMFGDDDDDED